jgi:hypothetical protein
MPNAVISGSLGNVTFASGFAVNPFEWEASISGLVRETTKFTPTSGYRTRESGGLSGWRGTYKCRQTVNASAAISGPAYVANPFAFSIKHVSNAAELPATKFGDTWRNYVSTNTLLDTTGDFSVYAEETAALPLPLTTATGLFTIDTGVTFSVPLIIGEEITLGVAVDGKSRIAKIPWMETAAPTIVGCPKAGDTGAATFLAHTSRQYSGNIIVVSAEISVNRDQPNSEWNIGFLGLGALTPA